MGVISGGKGVRGWGRLLWSGTFTLDVVWMDMDMDVESLKALVLWVRGGM